MKYGAKYLKFAPFSGTEPTNALPTYGSVIELAEMVKMADAPEYNPAKSYGSNRLVVELNEFKSAGVDAEITDLTNAQASTIFGASNTTDLEFGDDDPPFGGLVCISNLMKNDGTRKYQGVYYPKVRAVPPQATEYASKGESITLVNDKVKFTAYQPNYGKWKILSPEYSTEADAKAWCDAKIGSDTYYTVDVQVNGAGSGEAASPVGCTLVKSGESFELSVTGTATALYDNGTDSVSSISSSKYTISSIAANHTISVIF